MATAESKTEVPAEQAEASPSRSGPIFCEMPAGSPIRLSPKERARRARSARQTLADMQAIKDDPDEDDQDRQP